MRVLILGLILVHGVIGSASAQGLWWDIGSGEAQTIPSAEDPASSIEFPPYAFGDFWVPGTLVYSELAKVAPEAVFAENYVAYFSDGGCGCAGLPVELLPYRLHYDESKLRWPEDDTALYVIQNGQWRVSSTTIHDQDADMIIFEYSGLMPPALYMGIGQKAVEVPTKRSTWSGIKALYGARP